MGRLRCAAFRRARASPCSGPSLTEVAGSIGMVASVCPFTDLQKLICLATTRSYGDADDAETYEAAILLRRVVARSLLATLPDSAERTELLGPRATS